MGVDIDESVWDLMGDLQLGVDENSAEPGTDTGTTDTGSCPCRTDPSHEDVVHVDGDVMCTLCDTVLGRFLDDKAEWRGFTDGGGHHIRCGMPASELFPKSNLGSAIGYNTGTYHSKRLRRYQLWNSMPYKERNLYNITDHIGSKGATYNLPPAIIDDAKMMYKNISTNRISRGKSKSGLIASCIYMSCKSNNAPRSAREVARMFGVGLSTMTKGCKRFNDIVKMTTTSSTSAHHFIQRFCSSLRCEDIMDTCMYVANKTSELGVVTENAPTSIAAACLYMVCQYAKPSIDKRLISSKCDISEVTVNKCYKKLYEYRGVVLPDEFIYKYTII